MLAVLVPLFLVFALSSGSQATPKAEGEDVEIPASTVTITEKVILPPVTLPAVTLPPVTLPPVTLPPIRLPGATVTVPGVRLPPIILPGPRSTETVTRSVRQTETVRVPVPESTRTVKVPESTVTVTEPGGRQTVTEYDTVTPSPDVVTNTETTTETKTVVKRVVLGTLISLALAGLGFLAMLAGYSFGQKDAQRNEDNFMRSLLDKVSKSDT